MKNVPLKYRAWLWFWTVVTLVAIAGKLSGGGDGLYVVISSLFYFTALGEVNDQRHKARIATLETELQQLKERAGWTVGM